MPIFQLAILFGYFFVLVILGMYGWHRFFLVREYTKHKDRAAGPVPHVADDAWPMVTVQLPFFNEMYVVDRLVDAVCKIDYPRELLEIQVLDDSTDETQEIAALAVRRHALQGVDIKYLHREDRTGYKAGALDAGLKLCKGDFIAIFDADFIPSPDFLKRTVQPEHSEYRDDRFIAAMISVCSLVLATSSASVDGSVMSRQISNGAVYVRPPYWKRAVYLPGADGGCQLRSPISSAPR